MTNRVLLVVAVVAVAILAGAGPASADVIRIDMGAQSPLEPGWNAKVGAGSRFDNGTAVNVGNGVRAGYDAWNVATEPSWVRTVSGTWPAGYGADLQGDFSFPTSGHKLIIWNLPAGSYQVTLYMRDWDYPNNTFTEAAHDGTIFSVDGNAMVSGDLSSISSTKTLSTISYDPDAGAYYDAQPSIWFTYASSAADIMGIELTAVPEPATLGLLALGGLALWRAAGRSKKTMA